MKIPTQKIQICVGIFLQHYTFLQKRTFSILCENFSRFVRKATTVNLKTSILYQWGSGDVQISKNKRSSCLTAPLLLYASEK